MLKKEIKTRIEKESNYKSVWCNGKTLRFALNQRENIKELKYPEFYDVKITGNCEGNCSYCYMDSKPEKHYENILSKTKSFFGNISIENRPYQVAIGGGEPTSHPDFIDLLKLFDNELNICPNYTTNGMFIKSSNSEEILEASKKYCGGVAVSCHGHLDEYWMLAANKFYEYEIKLNFHIIISDKKSIDRFTKIYDEWNNKVEYFVLLPYGNQGRAIKKEIEWDYLVSKLPLNQSKIAFGANFYPYLQKGNHNIKVALYEPEIMSKFLDLKDMKIYPSSFNLVEK